jgi:hypothetical protein
MGRLKSKVSSFDVPESAGIETGQGADELSNWMIMKVEHIEDALENAPFELELENGTKLTVRHADYLLFTESRQTIIVTIGEHFHVIPIEKITAIKAAVK